MVDAVCAFVVALSAAKCGVLCDGSGCSTGGKSSAEAGVRGARLVGLVSCGALVVVRGVTLVDEACEAVRRPLSIALALVAAR